MTRRKGVNSRAKGSTYERHVAKQFAAWCGESLRRTPMSGGWSKDKDFNVSGDLVATNPHFPLHIEAKNHKTWRLDDLLTGIRSDHSTSLRQWWLQCQRECPEGKIPMLVFKVPRGHDLAMVMYTGLEVPYPLMRYTFTDLTPDTANGEVAIFTLKDFFANTQPWWKRQKGKKK